jgi:hypothetical protein
LPDRAKVGPATQIKTFGVELTRGDEVEGGKKGQKAIVFCLDLKAHGIDLN